jgi:protein SCO1/2
MWSTPRQPCQATRTVRQQARPCSTPSAKANRPRRDLLLGAFAVAALAAWWPTAHGAESATADPHAGHVLTLPGTKRIVADYRVPDITLLRDDGRSVSIAGELQDDRPVVLAFIYTSCTTVCPVISAVMADLQARLGVQRDKVHMVSISIDPEYDTPAVLRAYAKRFDAGPQWQHYTGTLAASREVQRAFDVYRGDKMSHQPVVMVRPLPGARWVRLDGFATGSQLMAELPDNCITR